MGGVGGVFTFETSSPFLPFGKDVASLRDDIRS